MHVASAKVTQSKINPRTCPGRGCTRVCNADTSRSDEQIAAKPPRSTTTTERPPSQDSLGERVEVEPHRPREEEGRLRHDRHPRPQVVKAHGGNVDAVDLDCPPAVPSKKVRIRRMINNSTYQRPSSFICLNRRCLSGVWHMQVCP